MNAFFLKKTTILFCMAILLSGCSKTSDNKTSNAHQTEPEKTLIIAINNDENSLTPFNYVSGTGLIVNRLIYDTLLTQDKDGKIIPWMVEDDYHVSDDNRIFTFKLKDGQFFHNGQPVLSEDVKFSFEYPANKNAAIFRKIANAISTIETPDEKTIIFTLKKPDITFELDGFSRMRIIPKSLYQDQEDASLIKSAVGSGMYKLVEYKTGQYYKLEAVQNYFKGNISVKNINMPIVVDKTAVQQGLLSGQFAAATSGIGIETVDLFKSKPGAEICASAGYSPLMLNLNNEQKNLSNLKIRQALAYGIDVNSISKTLYGNYALAGSRAIIRSDLDYSKKGLEYQFDKNRAISLLQEAGYKKINSEGYRLDEKDNILSFEIITYSGDTIRSRLAELVTAYLKEIGIKTTVKAMEMDTVDSYVWPDFEVSKGRNYDIATWSWSNTNTPTFLISLASSDFSTGIYNVMGYKSKRFDEVINEKYANLSNMMQMSNLLHELQDIVAEEIPAIVIAYPDSLQVCNKKQHSAWVTGKGMNIVNIFSFLN